MKSLLLNALFILYSFAAMLVLGWAMLYPFGLAMDDFPAWTGWFTFPLALVVMVTQKKVIQFFTDKKVLN